LKKVVLRAAIEHSGVLKVYQHQSIPLRGLRPKTFERQQSEQAERHGADDPFAFRFHIPCFDD
jgi:hypothetical protein